MALGDSLTWGWDGNSSDLETIDTGGYRDPLYTLLSNDGIDFNYVGVSNENASPTLTAAGETAQNGFNGYRIDEIEGNLAGSVPSASGQSNRGGYWLTGGGGTGRGPETANIILLQIGANDIVQGYDPLYTGTPGAETAAQLATDTATRLQGLINTILTYEPNATLLVDGTSYLVNNGFCSQASADYDQDVDNLILSDYAGTNVHYVNMYAGLWSQSPIPGYEYYEGDGVHLNALGYQQMAQVWYDAILADYNFNDASVTAPEPSTWVLFVVGALALTGWHRWRKNSRTQAELTSPK